MKHNLHQRTIIFLIIISALCNAMETKQHYIKKIKDLPTLADQNYRTLLTDNEVIIQGEEQWVIADITTDKLITKLHDTASWKTTGVHSNNKRFILYDNINIERDKRNIKLYDTTTKEKIGKYTPECLVISCGFHPSHHNSIVIMESDLYLTKITEYDYLDR